MDGRFSPTILPLTTIEAYSTEQNRTGTQSCRHGRLHKRRIGYAAIAAVLLVPMWHDFHTFTRSSSIIIDPSLPFRIMDNGLRVATFRA